MNRIKPLTGILFCLSVLNPTAGSGSNPASEHKIDSLLRLMTLEEKVSMCAGAAPRMAFQGVPDPTSEVRPRHFLRGSPGVRHGIPLWPKKPAK